MLKIKLSHRGFTIVELLIVIVVIGILAGLVFVQFNNTQARARNAQTISAVSAYAKVLGLYQTATGSLPTIASCLGETYGYGPSGTDSSGVGQCRQDTAGSGITVQASFYTTIAPYLELRPQPATSATYVNSSTNWYRGAYYYTSSPRRIDFVLEGNIDCPTIGGLTFMQRSVAGNVTRCVMSIQT